MSRRLLHRLASKHTAQTLTELRARHPLGVDARLLHRDVVLGQIENAKPSFWAMTEVVEQLGATFVVTVRADGTTDPPEAVLAAIEKRARELLARFAPSNAEPEIKRNVNEVTAWRKA